MIVAAGVLIVVGAASFAIAVVSGALLPLYASIVASLAALVALTLAGLRHLRRERRVSS